MKGDFSRRTFDHAKHYTAVLTQQGRVQVDADDNEEQSIRSHLRETTTRDVIGPTGAPKDDAGFGLDTTNGGLVISKGRFYVDGLLCENEEDVAFAEQPQLPDAAPPEADGLYLAVLHAWDRHVTALHDPAIREKALGGPDTATRVQTAWQVLLVRVGDRADAQGATCASAFDAWDDLVAGSTGGLAARTTPAGGTNGDPCILPAGAGYRRLENQLYRVEVHRGGARADARFKWSRDNGAVAVALEQPVDGSKVTVRDLGRDEQLGLAVGQWVEVLDENMELTDGRGALARIQAITPETREVTLDAAALPQVDMDAHPLLRRWDQADAATEDGLELGGDWLKLGDDGIEVRFAEGTYRAGDYWTIPARTAVSEETGGIEWPVDGSGDPLEEAPEGVRHRHARLALLDFDGEGFAPVADCRPIFAPLTQVAAPPAGGGGACKLVARPGPDWESVFDEIADGADARVCFQTGEYPLREPLRVQGKGRITLHGAGAGTRIVGKRGKAAFVFEKCANVTVRELSAEGKLKEPGEREAGILVFNDCAEVTLESCDLRCEGLEQARGACLAITNESRAGSVRVLHCDLALGAQQTGMQIVGVERLHLEDNTVKSIATPDEGSSNGIVVGGRHPGELRLIDNTLVGLRLAVAVAVKAEGAAPGGARRVEITGNTMDLVRLPDPQATSVGIMLAGADSMVVQRNTIRAPSAAGGPPLQGSAIVGDGVFGRLLIIRDNHIAGYQHGIQLNPREPRPDRPQWIVADNLVEGGRALRLTQDVQVRSEGNVAP